MTHSILLNESVFLIATQVPSGTARYIRIRNIHVATHHAFLDVSKYNQTIHSKQGIFNLVSYRTIALISLYCVLNGCLTPAHQYSRH